MIGRGGKKKAGLDRLSKSIVKERKQACEKLAARAVLPRSELSPALALSPLRPSFCLPFSFPPRALPHHHHYHHRLRPLPFPPLPPLFHLNHKPASCPPPLQCYSPMPMLSPSHICLSSLPPSRPLPPSIPALPRPPSSLCRPQRPAPIPYGRFPKQEGKRGEVKVSKREGRRKEPQHLMDVCGMDGIWHE